MEFSADLTFPPHEVLSGTGHVINNHPEQNRNSLASSAIRYGMQVSADGNKQDVRENDCTVRRDAPPGPDK